MIPKFNLVRDDIKRAFAYDCDIIVISRDCHDVVLNNKLLDFYKKFPKALVADINGICQVTGMQLSPDYGRLGRMTGCTSIDAAIINFYTHSFIKGIDWVQVSEGLSWVFEIAKVQNKHIAMNELGCSFSDGPGEVEDFYAMLNNLMQRFPSVEVTIFR